MNARARPGIAIAALGAIVAVTVTWWALALYPADAATPGWLLRTRLACFGAAPGGLPNAGGWILLIGEPVGMAAVLVVVWEAEVRSGMRALASRVWGSAVLAVVGGSLAWGLVSTVRLVRRVNGVGRAPLTVVWAGDDVVLPTTSVPELALIDQDGQPFDLRTLRGTPVIVTFLYAHCQTVCPTVMRDVLRARRDAGREEVPIVVVTLDPWRDVVARLPAIAREWNFAAHDRILTGTIGDVNRTLDAWGVSRARDDRTGELAHIAVVVLVDRDGRRAYRTDGNPVRLRELLVAAL